MENDKLYLYIRDSDDGINASQEGDIARMKEMGYEVEVLTVTDIDDLDTQLEPYRNSDKEIKYTISLHGERHGIGIDAHNYGYETLLPIIQKDMNIKEIDITSCYGGSMAGIGLEYLDPGIKVTTHATFTVGRGVRDYSLEAKEYNHEVLYFTIPEKGFDTEKPLYFSSAKALNELLNCSLEEKQDIIRRYQEEAGSKLPLLTNIILESHNVDELLVNMEDLPNKKEELENERAIEVLSNLGIVGVQEGRHVIYENLDGSTGGIRSTMYNTTIDGYELGAGTNRTIGDVVKIDPKEYTYGAVEMVAAFSREFKPNLSYTELTSNQKMVDSLQTYRFNEYHADKDGSKTSVEFQKYQQDLACYILEECKGANPQYMTALNIMLGAKTAQLDVSGNDFHYELETIMREKQHMPDFVFEISDKKFRHSIQEFVRTGESSYLSELAAESTKQYYPSVEGCMSIYDATNHKDPNTSMGAVEADFINDNLISNLARPDISDNTKLMILEETSYLYAEKSKEALTEVLAKEAIAKGIESLLKSPHYDREKYPEFASYKNSFVPRSVDAAVEKINYLKDTSNEGNRTATNAQIKEIFSDTFRIYALIEIKRNYQEFNNKVPDIEQLLVDDITNRSPKHPPETPQQKSSAVRDYTMGQTLLKDFTSKGMQINEVQLETIENYLKEAGEFLDDKTYIKDSKRIIKELKKNMDKGHGSLINAEKVKGMAEVVMPKEKEPVSDTSLQNVMGGVVLDGLEGAALASEYGSAAVQNANPETGRSV